MTIDERIEKLTERHEALTQTVEVLAADGKLATARIQMLAEAVSKQFDSIDRLSRIAQAHEHRITRLEGGASV